MKIRSLILTGLLAVLVFAVALLPASLAWRIAGVGLALPVSVDRVSGTVWNGFVTGRLRHELAPGPVVIRWNLKALHLLLGEAVLDLGVEGAQYRLQGQGYWGLWGKGLQDFNGDIRMAMLEQALTQFGVSAGGAVKIEGLTVKFAGNRVGQADGQINWSGGQVQVSGPDGTQVLDFPGVQGKLEARDGNLFVNVTETRNNKPLGELSLLPEQGLAGVKVLKRVMVLAGFDAGGDEDRVLVSLQQPLPY